MAINVSFVDLYIDLAISDDKGERDLLLTIRTV